MMTTNTIGMSSAAAPTHQMASSGGSADALSLMIRGETVSEPLTIMISHVHPVAHMAGEQDSEHRYLVAEIARGASRQALEVLLLDVNANILREGTASYVVRVNGYITSKAHVDEASAFLCLTSLDVLLVLGQAQVNETSTIHHHQQSHIQGGHAGTFLDSVAPLFSNSQLAGRGALGLNHTTLIHDDHILAVTNFLRNYQDMKLTNQANLLDNVFSERCRQYMASLEEFQTSQMDLQRASLVSNEGHVSKEVATRVADQHHRALNLALEPGKVDLLTVEGLQTVHRELCDGGLTPNAGQFRTQAVRAGRTKFTPPEKVHEEMKKFLEALSGNIGLKLRNEPAESILGRVTFAAALMYGILDVHPFADGNGRLARIAANWALYQLGLPFCIHLFATPTQRREYVDAIQSTRRNLSLVARGNASEDLLVHVFPRAGLFLPLVNLLLDRMAKAVTEFGRLIAEKSTLSSEELEAKAARRHREKAAAGSCIICYDDKPNVATLCCGKAVHLNCIAQWLSSRNTCPQVRALTNNVTVVMFSNFQYPARCSAGQFFPLYQGQWQPRLKMTAPMMQPMIQPARLALMRTMTIPLKTKQQIST